MSKAVIGKPAPPFTATAVVNGDFKTVSLSDYKGQYVVLFFYPMDFTFVCPTEIIAFSEHAERFKKLGVAVLAASTDSQFSHLAWINVATFVCPTEIIAFSEHAERFKKLGVAVLAASTDSQFSHLAWINTPRKQGGLGEMKIPILSDNSHQISRDYGVLKEDDGIAYRGLFIIDSRGILRQITINDLPVGRSVAETMRLVQAFQFVDTHGEVCPAGWTPGADTIKPAVKESKAYFQKH
ncbi:Peroxiredoxin [Toxocara canis]|uniref:thioredoxin-dependent peroxiredoxin n=1 Tax=Toxocara canis TaxID=6265 RepID=A0A0B2UVB5_TOXCA|nr:Peroxiredoxin [Toxocara canis]